jgi:hypothetical protein
LLDGAKPQNPASWVEPLTQSYKAQQRRSNVQGLSSNRTATPRYLALPALLALFGTAVARADSTACGATDTSLNCRLVGLLHWLEAAATILAILLIVVIAIAIHLFRKNRVSRKAGR